MRASTRGVLILLAALALLCSPAAAALRQYEVWATDGWVTMSDGTVKYAFGFNDTGVRGQIQVPSPLVWAKVGDEVHLTLHNLGFTFRPDLEDPHTIHLHGIHVVPYYDGFGESSFEIGMGESFTYKFKAEREGTFIYHCHVEAVEHVQMGMYGPLVIFGEEGPGTIYGREYTQEYVWLVSELDSRWHRSLEPGFVPPAIPDHDQTDPPIPWDQWVRVNYRPDYWLINGLGFPDTIRSGGELPLVTLNPDSLGFPEAPEVVGIQNGIHVANPGTNSMPATMRQSALVELETDEPVLVRIIHMGYEAHPLHLHGTHFEILGSDAHPRPHLQQAHAAGQVGGDDDGDDDSEDDGDGDGSTAGHAESGVHEEKFTILVGSGETWDTLVVFPKELKCASDALVPKPEAIPPGAVTTDISVYDPDPDGYWWYPMHCHDDYHVADQGIYPSGLATLLKVKKPDCDAHDTDPSGIDATSTPSAGPRVRSLTDR